ncbi:MAG: uroporphyrinogen decarboxylase family protein [Armatimonadota bacterium]
MHEHMSPKWRFLSAISGGRVDRPSIGTVTSLANTDAMDFCGLPFPLAHRDSEAMAQLAAYISEEAGFDTITPVFSVVHESAALGAPVHWGQKDTMPTITAPLWRESEEIAIPDDFEQQEGMAVVLEALRLLRDQYGDRYALIGKAFGPWTLGFHLFGVETMLIMTIENPEKVRRILGALMEVTIRSAYAQIHAGADAICLGDHCSRDMCSPVMYRDFLLPLHQKIARRIPCPVVLHTCGDTADRLPLFAETSFSCFHFDTRVPAALAKTQIQGRISLMGGISNLDALRGGDRAWMRSEVRAALDAGVEVIGPECAIPLDTSMHNLKMIKAALQQLLTQDGSGERRLFMLPACAGLPVQ